MTGVSDKSKPDKEKGLRGDLSLCHFWHTNIGGGQGVGADVCMGGGGGGGQNLTKVLGIFSHTTAVVCAFVFAVCSFGWTAGRQRFARVWLSRLEKWRAPSNHLENA